MISWITEIINDNTIYNGYIESSARRIFTIFEDRNGFICLKGFEQFSNHYSRHISKEGAKEKAKDLLKK